MKKNYNDTPQKRAYRKKWSEENKERLREQDRAWKAANRERVNELARERYRNNRVKELDRIRFSKYGITGEEFRALLNLQNKRCPICNRKINKNLSVDHDHKTGKIRGLICNPCNLAIGNAHDSPERLRAMANYLENQQ